MSARQDPGTVRESVCVVLNLPAHGALFWWPQTPTQPPPFLQGAWHGQTRPGSVNAGGLGTKGLKSRPCGPPLHLIPGQRKDRCFQGTVVFSAFHFPPRWESGQGGRGPRAGAARLSQDACRWALCSTASPRRPGTRPDVAEDFFLLS